VSPTRYPESIPKESLYLDRASAQLGLSSVDETEHLSRCIALLALLSCDSVEQCYPAWVGLASRVSKRSLESFSALATSWTEPTRVVNQSGAYGDEQCAGQVQGRDSQREAHQASARSQTCEPLEAMDGCADIWRVRKARVTCSSRLAGVRGSAPRPERHSPLMRSLWMISRTWRTRMAPAAAASTAAAARTTGKLGTPSRARRPVG
jgi:hypothetical protein